MFAFCAQVINQILPKVIIHILLLGVETPTRTDLMKFKEPGTGAGEREREGEQLMNFASNRQHKSHRLENFLLAANAKLIWIRNASTNQMSFVKVEIFLSKR